MHEERGALFASLSPQVVDKLLDAVMIIRARFAPIISFPRGTVDLANSRQPCGIPNMRRALPANLSLFRETRSLAYDGQ